MLYKKNSSPVLSEELFKNPTCEYRGTPFWAWNSKLNIDELERQIDIFKEMGLGGFHMHVRTGMDTPYLSEEFMSLVKGCVKKAKKEEMLAWLYDEDRWPSGAAGGIVTKDEQYRARCLLFTPTPCSLEDAEKADVIDSRAEGGRGGKGYLICCYDVILDDDGYLKSYKIIDENEQAQGTKWYAYLKIHAPTPWHNGQTYVNTLDKKSIERFVEVTHENYKKAIGDEFDETVPAIFTDEPQFTRKSTLGNSTEKKDVILPWTDSLPDSYKAQYGEDIIASLPELFWELPDKQISSTRYHYHDHICELFTEAFADTCGDWCKKNNIALTGHMMEEPTLHSQCAALGEAMRSYRSFGIPGIDMLCALFEFTTAKQAQSAVHQFGREAMLSELYGVTGWDYDFRGYKLHGDWQACLGVTVRVPHLSWFAMGGEAKRDYPASIHYQSPWYGEYSYLEDHFARINTAMTRGKPIVKVGVIHPIESFWLHWGPNDKTGLERSYMNEKFQNLTSWLLRGSVDFDFISESLLPELCENGSAPLKVGYMEYDAVIVPDCESLRATTVERLEAFRKNGGKLIFMGSAPTVSDGKFSDIGKKLYEKSQVISYDKSELLNALEAERTVTLRDSNGSLTNGFIYQLRQDNDCKWLFISRCEEPYNKCMIGRHNLRISVKGTYLPMEYDTISGEIRDIPCEYINGNTVIAKTLYDYDSLLLKLCENERSDYSEKEISRKFTSTVTLPDYVDFTLSERNVLLLDTAEFSLDGGEFKPEEEILRLDNICRAEVGYPERGGHVVQPWCIEKEIPSHIITLRFSIFSDIDYSGAELAAEDMEALKIRFNGENVDNAITGIYVDNDIKTVALPEIRKGKNILEIDVPFGTRTNTEWCYILGDFGVKVEGKNKRIIALPEKLAFGSILNQGLPFYGGNITYHLDAESNGALQIEATNYKGALISVAVDGEEKGKIVYPPYVLLADGLNPGKHKVDITLFGNRYNAFGPVHLCNEKESWHGPGAWRSGGCAWCYEYVLRSIGILNSPIIRK